MTLIREPAVAGLFYPARARALKATVASLLAAAGATPGPAPKALIVPHAGYRYSGPVAASAYARLQPHRDRYSRVLLLGPSHRVPMHDVATSAAHVFRTPLGDVEVEHRQPASLPHGALRVLETAHSEEHSLEVHLPFLQTVLGLFSLVPLVVGDAPPEEVAGVIDAFWGGQETLVVVSTDLSHGHEYARARDMDRATCAAIEHLDERAIGHGGACGLHPLGGMLMTARRRGMHIETLDLRNSGDVGGDRNSVVGYGAWMLVESDVDATAH